MRPAATPRWLGLLRAAVTVILVALFGAGTASAATAPAPETRLGAHAVDTQGVVGPHRDVCADRWLGGDTVAAVPRLALEYVYDGGAASYDASARLVDVRTVVRVDAVGRQPPVSALRRQSGAAWEGSVSVSGFVVAAKAGTRLPLGQIKITGGGVNAVERHLGRFPDAGEGLGVAEAGMAARLRSIAAGDLAPASQDLRFYSHELRESVLYRKAGYPAGQPAGDAGYDLWDTLHTQALNDYGFARNLAPDFLYHPSVLGGG